MRKKSEYDIQAEKFLEKTNTKITVDYSHTGKHFSAEDDIRDIYIVNIVRKWEGAGGREERFAFHFGDSLQNTKQRRIDHYEHSRKWSKPSAYSVLACLTKHFEFDNVGDFAREFGYEIDDEKSMNKVTAVYLAVKDEYKNVVRLFGDVMEELSEIW